MKRNLFLSLCIIILFISCNQIAVGKNHSSLTQIQTILDMAVSQGKFPGVTFGAILKDGTELSVAAGFADYKKQIKLKSEARIFTGSTGKTFVSAFVMQLLDEGKVNLEDKVEKYLGEKQWFNRIPGHDLITVKMLMNHTSGLPRYVMKPGLWTLLMEKPDTVLTPVETLTYILDDPLVHEPGKGWAYSDTNYIVLGLIIEKVTGNTLYNGVHKRFLTPLKLNLTTPSVGRVHEGLPDGYTGNLKPPFNLPEKVMENGKYIFEPGWEWTGGGFITNSLDLAKWGKALYEGSLFSQKSMNNLMNTVSTGENVTYSYGLGVMKWENEDGVFLGHGGIFPGYQTIMLYHPDSGISMGLQVTADRTGDKLTISPDEQLIQIFKVLNNKKSQ